MDSNRNLKINALLTFLMTGAFLAFHFSIEYFYRISADDFSGIDYATQGFPGFSYAWRFYWNWEGPFLSMILQGFLMYAIAIGIPAFLLLGLIRTAMLFSGYVLLGALSQRFALNWKKSQRVWGATVFVLTLYLISPETSQIWHWAIGSIYLYPLIFVQLGITLLLRDKILLAAVPLAFVVQSRATYSLIFFGALFLFAAFQWFVNNPKKKEWAMLCAILLVFLIVYLIAPGNYMRMTDTEFDMAHRIGQFKKGVQNLILSYNIAKLDRVFFGVLAFIPLMAGLKKLLPEKKGYWSIPVILYLLFMLVHETLFVYITGYCEWERVLSLHSFLFLITCMVYGVWFGILLLQMMPKSGRPLGLLGVTGLMSYLFSGFANERTMAQQFSKEYDQRMETILAFEGTFTDTLFVAPISYDGILYFEDLSTDPDNWINKDLTKAYNLDFKVAVRQKK